MARITRERAHRLVDLVFESNEFLGSEYIIGFEFDKYCDELTVWMEPGNLVTNYYCYTTVGKSYTNKNIMAINDSNLEKGEAFIRRLIAEKKEEKNDTV